MKHHYALWNFFSKGVNLVQIQRTFEKLKKYVIFSKYFATFDHICLIRLFLNSEIQFSKRNMINKNHKHTRIPVLFLQNLSILDNILCYN